MARAKGNLETKQVGNLPVGFAQFSGGEFPTVHDFKTEPKLTLEVKGVKIVPVAEKGKPGTKNFKPAKNTRLMIGVNIETGEETSVWESAGTESLINQIEPKDQVHFDYKGLVRTKDGNNFHKFIIGVKTHDRRELTEVRKEKEANKAKKK